MLLPFDHPVGAVVQEDDDDIESETDCRLQVSEIHYESSVSRDAYDLRIGILHLRDDGGREPGTHRGERIIQDDRIRDVGRVIPCDPYLVEAVIEGDDGIIRKRRPQFLDESPRLQDLRPVLMGDVLLHLVPVLGVDLVDFAEIPAGSVQLKLVEPPESVRDIADDLVIRRIHIVEGGRVEIDVNHLGALVGDDVRRLLDDVIPDRKDQIGLPYGIVDVIVFGQCSRSKALIEPFIDHSFPHLRAEKRDVVSCDEFPEVLRDPFPVRPRSDEDDRTFRLLEPLFEYPDGSRIGMSSSKRCFDDGGDSLDLFPGDIFCKLEMDRSRPLHLSNPEGIPYGTGNPARIHDRHRGFGDRLHHGDDIDDLEMSLFTLLYRLLPGDHDDRHPSKLGIGDAGDHIRGSRPESGKGDSRGSGESSIGRRHEYGGLLVSRQDELDLRMPEGIQQIKVLFTRHSEYIADSLVLETSDE